MSERDTPAQPTTRKLLDAWFAGLEATVKTGFQLQAASLDAGRALFEHWEAAVEQSQQAVLDVLQARLHPATHAESAQ
jgi:hypothetical protein